MFIIQLHVHCLFMFFVHCLYRIQRVFLTHLCEFIYSLVYNICFSISRKCCLYFKPTYISLMQLNFLIFYFLVFIFLINLFILFRYFWLPRVFVAARVLSLVAASGGYSSLRCTRFSLRWLLLLRSTGSRCAGFSSCGTWAQQLQRAGSRAQLQQLWLVGSRTQAQQLWRTGLVAPRHVGPSRTRARTRVPCTGGRRILNHCTTREAPLLVLNLESYLQSRDYLIKFSYSFLLLYIHKLF